MAQANANLGRYDEAIRCCRSALATDSLEVPAHYLLAHLIEGQGKHEDAIAILKRVLYLDPNFPAAYLDLGALYERMGDSARARQMRVGALEVLKTLPPDTVVAAYAPMTAGELVAYVQTMLGAA
jgi:tetratricopeptide (TPR) repeat protein